MPDTPYLHDIPLDQALEIFHARLNTLGLDGLRGVETIPLNEKAAGRVLAEDVFAQRCAPHYHASAMDGFALRSKDTQGAMPSRPITLTLIDQAVFVDTGDPLPDWADAVVPVENVESLNAAGEMESLEAVRAPQMIRLRQPSTPWSHVRPVGEDLVVGQLIFTAGEHLRPVDLGAIAAGGVTEIRVVKKPIIGILPTGDELVPVRRDLQKGEISEFNSIVLAAQLEEWGAVTKRYPVIKDDLSLLKLAVLSAAAECDLLLINAGSSAGREDFTAQVIRELGEVLVHGVAVRPGHPVVLGIVHLAGEVETHCVPVIGVPGYPVSSAMTAEIFVKPLVQRWTGSLPIEQEEVTSTLTRKINSLQGMTITCV